MLTYAWFQQTYDWLDLFPEFFFFRLLSIKYFYLDSQINWLPSIRMTCCITESTPHASLTKWKIINSLHGQVSIQCWSAPFSAITYAQVIVFLAKIEHECYLFCRAYHASLFSVLIQLMLQINYAITIFFLYIGNTHGCKDNSLFFVKHNILVIGTRKQWIGYHTELIMEACLFALAPAMLCHVCSYWHLPYFHNSQHPACPFSTKSWYFFCGVLTKSLVTNFVSYLLLPIFRENFCQFKLCYWIYVVVFLIFSLANNYLWGGCVRHA